MTEEFISRTEALKDFESCNAENPNWTPQRGENAPAASARCRRCAGGAVQGLQASDGIWKLRVSTAKRCFAIGISIRFLQLRRPAG